MQFVLPQTCFGKKFGTVTLPGAARFGVVGPLADEIAAHPKTISQKTDHQVYLGATLKWFVGS